MPGQPNYKITRTQPGSTAALGYHQLSDYAGAIPHGQPVALPAPAGQTASFVQGVADAVPQGHHAARSFVVGALVGAVVGDALARMRYGRR